MEDVQTCMAGIQASRKDYLPGEAVSADETAVLFGLPPSHQYVPEGARRGSTAHGDEKARYTSMQMGDEHRRDATTGSGRPTPKMGRKLY